MENYIVRIYRRDSADSEQIAGIVESVERNENIMFKSIEELMHIMRVVPNADKPEISNK